MPSAADALRDLERGRLRALVDADPEVLDAVHAPDFILINPSGEAWTKAVYVGGVLAGDIDYRRFEPVSEIKVIVDRSVAVLRYRSAIDIRVRGRVAGPLECWHMDCYRTDPPDTTATDGRWRAVWSQATEIHS